MMQNVPYRAGAHISEWVEIGANQQVLDWIENGIRLPFSEYPPSFEICNRRFNSEQYNFISAEIRELVAKGVIRQVNYSPICISPVSCVPKKGNKLRLITDLRRLNKYCLPPKFSAENNYYKCGRLY